MYQIIWLILQIMILTVVWSGTRIQVKRGDISIINAAAVIVGTLVYCMVNNLILVLGGFFDKLW